MVKLISTRSSDMGIEEVRSGGMVDQSSDGNVRESAQSCKDEGREQW